MMRKIFFQQNVMNFQLYDCWYQISFHRQFDMEP